MGGLGAAGAGDFLETMLGQSRLRVAEARRTRPLVRPFARPLGGSPEGASAARPRTGRLLAALVAGSRGPGSGPALIAEVKRASPSKGAIAPGLDAGTQARAYEAAGVDAVSVLTEPRRFGGSMGDLETVAAAISLPVLRKDFVVDAYQVWETALAGAAAVLLIVAALDDEDLAMLLVECGSCGLDALVEVHDEAQLERAVAAGAELIGINNRDLHTLTVDLRVSERLARRAPASALLVCESGIVTGADARRAVRAGARALLVGEALVRAPRERLAALVSEMKGAPRPEEVARP